MKPPASLLRQGSGLGLLTLGSRILGLVREMVKAAFLGTSAVSDAFTVAFLIPNLFRRLFAENSMSVAFIPTFREYFDKHGNGPELREFLSSIITVLSFLLTIVTLLGVACAPLIVPLFGTATDETVILTRIMFPYLAIISVAAFFQGILNGLRIFNPSGFTPILFNLIVIGTTFLLAPHMENPGRAMAVGVLGGGFVQALFQLPFVLRTNLRFGFRTLRTAFRHPGTKAVGRLIAPTLIGMAAYQINDVVSTALAGQAGTGVVSSLGYSLRLQELLLGIFAVTIGTIMLPKLSSLAVKEEWRDFWDQLVKSLNAILVITVPLSVFAFFYAEEIVTLLFRDNAFDAESVALTVEAFKFHLLGLAFIALNRVLAPAFYAQKDSKSPTWAGLLNFAVNIVLAAVLVGPMRGGGIALALSVASLVNAALLFVLLRGKPQVRAGAIAAGSFLAILRAGLASALAILPFVWLRDPLAGLFAAGTDAEWTFFRRLAEFGIPLALSALGFLVLLVGFLALLRDPTVLSIIRRFRRRPAPE